MSFSLTVPGFQSPDNLADVQETAVSTWTSVNSAQTNDWISITWSPELSLFVAVSRGGVNDVMTSSDGLTWNTANTTFGNGLAITWSPVLLRFVIVGINSSIEYSDDGSTWTTNTVVPVTNNWSSVTWSSELNLFIAISNGGVEVDPNKRVVRSSDGITWITDNNTGIPANNWNSVVWSPDLSIFLAVSDSGTGTEFAMTSPDGITWTTQSLTIVATWNSVVWSSELSLFVTVSKNITTNIVAYSNDGLTWQSSNTGITNKAWSSIIWSPQLSLFVAVANEDGTNTVMSSIDGITWTTRNVDDYFNTITWSPELSLFVAPSTSTGGTGQTYISDNDFSQYVTSSSYGTQGVTDVTVKGKDIDIGTSANNVVIGEYASNVSIGSPGIPVSIGGDLKVIGTATIDGSSIPRNIYSQEVGPVSNLDFLDLTGYSNYRIMIGSLTFSTDATNFLLRTSSDNGASFDSGGSDYIRIYGFSQFGGSNGNSSLNTSSISLITGVSNLITRTVNMVINVYTPNVSTTLTHFTYDISFSNSGGSYFRIFGAAVRNSAGIVNALRFLPSSGTMSGVFQITAFE